MDTIKQCFDVILSGSKEESRLAARRVRKLVYGPSSGKEKYERIAALVESAPETYFVR